MKGETKMEKTKFEKFVDMSADYMKAETLVGKWNLLSARQKKDAYDLKKSFGWPIRICIQQVLFFRNTVEKENRMWGRT